MGRYTIGVDFGTASGRAVLVSLENGAEVATSVFAYEHGVIDERLPVPGSERLPPEWALQDPDDYLRTLANTIPAVLREAGVDPTAVVGLGIDFTSCTMLPTTADGTPLCRLPDFRTAPHAWVKLWKHHAAQPEADEINAVARRLGEPWLADYGGTYSAEWFFSKALQIFRESPEIYRAADRLIEAADWIVWQLTGHESRNITSAGYKAIWSRGSGYPRPGFFSALDPGFSSVVAEKLSADVWRLGEPAGSLSSAAASMTGLREGTTVAVANVDAHASVPAVGVTTPGTIVAIMGTSTCHVVLGAEHRVVEGMCGVVEDGVVPGLYGYEAGQSGVGDIFAWFVEHAMPGAYRDAASERGLDPHDLLANEAAVLRPGQSGLLALDWWNGNRSILVDTALTGVLVGATLATRPPEIYRALIEATAYGTRMICDAFGRSGIAVDRIVACGGLPDRNPVLMQIYADVTGRGIEVGASMQTPAVGAAMWAAVAAGTSDGGYATIEDAALRMVRPSARSYQPNERNHAIYDELYVEYVRVHDYFGREEMSPMKRLLAIRAGVLGERESAAHGTIDSGARSPR